MHTLPLFDDEAPLPTQPLGPQAVLLRAFARPSIDALRPCIEAIAAASPFRRMVTPGGFTMSVALTNCGALGWTTDSRGYRYAAVDPLTGLPWPPMPGAFTRLAREAAAAAGFTDFRPDACLVNRYEPGARLALHQDKDERDLGAPIVSVSLGMTARFLFGGLERAHKAQQVALQHGDVVVWGGADRLRYHGVMPLQGEAHPLLGLQRINLTFRQAG